MENEYYSDTLLSINLMVIYLLPCIRKWKFLKSVLQLFVEFTFNLLQKGIQHHDNKHPWLALFTKITSYS